MVVITKEKCDKDHYYTLFNLEAMNAAMKDLCPVRSPSPFALWCYLAKNKDGHELALSNIAFSQQTGLSKDSYDFAVKTLIDKGYIVQEQGRRFRFYEKSRKE